MRKCTKCHEMKREKDYYKGKSGVRRACKECEKAVSRTAARNRSPEIKASRAAYSKSPKGRTIHRKAQKEWIKRNPERARVASKVRYAMKKGKLKSKPCEVCGCSIVHGHHDDYSKPLKVRWLCVKHHKAIHRREGT